MKFFFITFFVGCYEIKMTLPQTYSIVVRLLILFQVLFRKFWKFLKALKFTVKLKLIVALVRFDYIVVFANLGIYCFRMPKLPKFSTETKNPVSMQYIFTFIMFKSKHFPVFYSIFRSLSNGKNTTKNNSHEIGNCCMLSFLLFICLKLGIEFKMEKVFRERCKLVVKTILIGCVFWMRAKCMF